MRTLRLVLVAAVLAPAVGCAWLDRVRDPRPKPTGKIPEMSAEQAVGEWNLRAERLQSIEYKDAVMTVSGAGIPGSPAFDTDVACAQPRCFKLAGSGRMAAKVRMGSNPDQFWLYVDAPGGPPTYVYASHTDYESGRAEAPGGIPFEPDWVMQTLGMSRLPPGPAYTVRVDEKERAYVLEWPARTPSGATVYKEIVFDADAATGTRSQVKRHVVRDDRRKVIATAEIKAAHTVAAGNGGVFQYPTNIAYKWESPDFKMTLRLPTPELNRLTPGSQEYQAAFTRQPVKNVEAINLAEYRFAPPGK